MVLRSREKQILSLVYIEIKKLALMMRDFGGERLIWGCARQIKDKKTRSGGDTGWK